MNHRLDRQEKELTDTYSSSRDKHTWTTDQTDRRINQQAHILHPKTNTHEPQIRQIGEEINRHIFFIQRQTHMDHRLDRQENKSTGTHSSSIDKHTWTTDQTDRRINQQAHTLHSQTHTHKPMIRFFKPMITDQGLKQ